MSWAHHETPTPRHRHTDLAVLPITHLPPTHTHSAEVSRAYHAHTDVSYYRVVRPHQNSGWLMSFGELRGKYKKVSNKVGCRGEGEGEGSSGGACSSMVPLCEW